MNYFTTEWWAGETTNGQATVEAYWQYLESIRDKLPVSLVRFAYDFSLHDARITAAAFDPEVRALHLSFDGYRNGRGDDDCVERTFRLHYLGVAEVTGLGSHRLGEYGGFGSTEYDLVDATAYEQRMLFEHGEVSIRFTDFSFDFSD